MRDCPECGKPWVNHTLAEVTACGQEIERKRQESNGHRDS